MRRPLLAALLAAIFAVWGGLLGANPVQAEVLFPPGLRIGLEPQGDLTVSRRFSGFEDDRHKTAISILDLPARAYDDIERSAANTGLTDAKRENFPFAGGTGILISGSIQENGVTLRKWFLLANSNGSAIKDLATLVSVEVPDPARAVYSEATVRKMLASVTFRPTPLQEQLGLLPFKVGDLAGFRVMQVLPAGGVILTDGSADDITKQPYVIISVGSGSAEQPDDRARFANELLASTPLREVSVTSGEPMRIGGQQGYELRAQAKDLNGTPVALAQWVRFGSGGFLRVVGVGRKDNWDALFTRFRAIRDGITIK